MEDRINKQFKTFSLIDKDQIRRTLVAWGRDQGRAMYKSEKAIYHKTNLFMVTAMIFGQKGLRSCQPHRCVVGGVVVVVL
jgi:hypothetical protein